MSKVLKIVVGVIILYVVLMDGSGLAIKALVSSSIGEEVRNKAEATLPVEVSIDGGEFDVAEWFAASVRIPSISKGRGEPWHVLKVLISRVTSASTRH